MQSILIPVDGSRSGDAAVRCAIRQARLGHVGKVHLVSVQPHLGAYVGRFVGTGSIRSFQREQGERALANARLLLDEAGVAYAAHIYVGEAAATIARAAKELDATEIMIGSNGFGFLGTLGLNSLISSIIRRADVPVSVVKAPASELEVESATGQWQLRPTH